MTKRTEELQREIAAVTGPSRVRTDEPMSLHSSFRAGGPADLFVYVQTVQELQEVMTILQRAGEKWFLLGRGTNILVGDKGFRGCVITLTQGGIPMTDTNCASAPDVADEGGAQSLCALSVNGRRITAGAGAPLARAAIMARDMGLSGLEFAAGIPGSVGGGLVMNAGAYGGEIKDTAESVEALFPDGTVRTLTNAEMAFGYRQSVLKKNGAVALRAVFYLHPDEQEAITARMTDYAQRRRDKQPLEYPSAGSTFKRPQGHFAGQLIQQAGLAGFTVGGAMVSTKHCGFVINKDHASAADIRDVIRAVQKRVFETSGIELETEVILLGEF